MEIAAAAVAFIDFSIKLTNAAIDYTQSVRNAPASMKALLAQLEVIQTNLQNFSDSVKQEGVEITSDRDAIIRMIESCKGELESLLGLLERRSKFLPRKRRDKLLAAIRRLIWPISEKRVHEYFTIVDRCSTQLNLDTLIQIKISGLEQKRTVEVSKAEEVLLSLSAVKYLQTQDHQAAFRRYDGTGSWILQNETYLRWLARELPVLWLKGIHGSGKSVLMSLIIEKVLLSRYATEGGLGGAFLYCSFNDKASTDPPSILRTILMQLLSSQISRTKHIIKRIEKRLATGQGPPSNLDDLIRLIAEAGRCCEHSTIILDALDECEEARREGLLNRLIKVARESNGKIKLLVSSRPERDLEELFYPQHEMPLGDVGYIDLQVEYEHTKADMVNFIENSFRNERRLQRLDASLRERILTRLTESETFFQLVTCQLDEISRCITRADIIRKLESLPHTLRDTYTSILERIQQNSNLDFHPKFALHAFTWLCTAKRPLRLQEVNEALDFDQNQTALPTEETLLRPSILVELCGSLTNYDEKSGVFSLSHLTVKEYLTSDWLEQHDDLSAFYIKPQSAETKLAVTTLNYLLVPDFNSPLQLETLSSRVESQRTAARLLSYSAGYWTDHAKAALPTDRSEVLLQLVLRLLTDDSFKVNYRNFLKARVAAEHLNFNANMSHVINEYDPDLSPLYYPVLCGVTRVVERMLEMKPEWKDEPMGQYGTPMIVAAGQDDPAMIRTLKRSGADIDRACATRLWNEIRPLYYAVYLDNSAAVDTIMDLGANLDLGARYIDNNSETSTPILVTASYWGNEPMLRKLIDAGANLFPQHDPDGAELLHNAISAASLPSIACLISFGCNALAKAPSTGKNVLQQALELRHPQIISYLLSLPNISNPSVDDDLFGSLALPDIDWAKNHAFYPQLERLISQSTGASLGRPSYSRSDVYSLFHVLCRYKRLPRELALQVLDQGEVWIETVGRKELGEMGAVCFTERSKDEPYVSARVHGQLRRITFKTLSHDQGYSGEPEHHGRYSGSHTWFEAGILRPSPSQSHSSSTPAFTEIRTFDRPLIQRNVCARSEFRIHENVWYVDGATEERARWIRELQEGDLVGVWAKACYSGWQNWVAMVEVRVACALG